MKHLARITAIVFSALFLAVSVGIIVWISQDEKARLAKREQEALEQARLAHEAEERASLESAAVVETTDDVKRSLLDIETLLGTLSGDDLPPGS